jgi:hypothetical protein
MWIRRELLATTLKVFEFCRRGGVIQVIGASQWQGWFPMVLDTNPQVLPMIAVTVRDLLTMAWWTLQDGSEWGDLVQLIL